MKCTSQHETSIKVTISFNIGIETESHPEDIDNLTMRNLVAEYATDYLKTASNQGPPVIDSLIDDYKVEEVKMLVDGKVVKD